METGLLCLGACLDQHKHTRSVQISRAPKWAVEWKFSLGLDEDNDHDEALIRLMSGFLTIELREEVIIDPQLFPSRRKGGDKRLPPALLKSREDIAKAMQTPSSYETADSNTNSVSSNPSAPDPKTSPAQYILIGTVSIPLALVFSNMSKQKIPPSTDQNHNV